MDDPFYHFQLKKDGFYDDNPSWQHWGNREFFKNNPHIVNGKKFEELTCLNKFKNRTDPNYLNLKNKVQRDFSVDLNEYDMFSQVELGFPPHTLSSGKTIDHFVADQVFVKFDNLGDVEDMIVIENKLNFGTSLTPNQNHAKTLTGYTVRNTAANARVSQFNTSNVLSNTTNTNLNFANGKIKWYKVWDSETGESISGLEKL